MDRDTEIPQTGSSRSGWSLIGFANAAVNYEVWQPSQDGGGGGNVRALPLSPTPLTTGRLHHLVVTYDGSRIVGYFDGVNGNTRSASGAVQGGGDLYWGCQADMTSCLDDWLIDELAIYDSVLQPDRVKAHFDLGK